MRIEIAITIASFSLGGAFLIPNQKLIDRPSRLFADAVDTPEGGQVEEQSGSSTSKFDLDTALFCGGLAFDSYLEPPANSSRWERGVSQRGPKF
jgi:hypothetical protein